MTIALFLGGFAILFLAWRYFQPGSGSGTGLLGVAPRPFVAAWPLLGLLLLFFSHSEGTKSAGELANGIRLAGKTRIAVVEVMVSREGIQQTIRFGGDAAHDDIVLKGLPPDAIRLSSDGDRETIELRSAIWQDDRLEALVDDQPLVAGRLLQLGAQSTLVLRRHDEEKRAKGNSALPAFEQRFVISQTPAQWRIGFDSPDFLIVKPGSIHPATADLANQPRSGENVAPFRSLGARFAPLLHSTEMVLPKRFGESTLVLGNAQRSAWPNDRVIIAGAGSEVTMRVDPLTLEGGLRGKAFELLGWGLLLSVASTWAARRENGLLASLLGLAEILLILRVVLAIEGTMVEETMRSRNALPDGLVAFPMGMLALAAASLDIRRMAKAAAAYLAIFAAMLFQIRDKLGAIPETSLKAAVIMALLGMVLIAIRAGMGAMRSLDERLAAIAANAKWQLARLGSWRNAIVHSFGLGLLLVLARWILSLAEIRERIMVGKQSIGAMSMLVIPFTLLAAAPLFHRMLRREKPQEDWIGGLAFCVFLALFVLLPNAIFVSLEERVIFGDSGLAIVLALALAIFAALLRALLAPKGEATMIPVVLPVALGLVTGAAVVLVGNRDLASWMPSLGLIAVSAAWACYIYQRRGVAIQTQAAALAWFGPASVVAMAIAVTSVPALQPALRSAPESVSDLQESVVPIHRLTGALATERLGLFLGDRAAEFRQTQRDLAMYADTDQGRGYLNVPVIRPSIKNQQFSDFAIAVHFISPFGRYALAGLLALLLVPLPFAWARFDRTCGKGLFGIMTLVVFVATSTYIALVNLLLAPMTGRNFYLLAPQSQSDLTEGILLLALCLVSLASVRPDRAGAT